GRAARVLAEAREHRDLPFAALVEALQPAREPGRMPLFQVAFGFEETPEGSGGAVDAVDSGRIPYELALTCLRAAAGGGRAALGGGNGRRFEPATIRRMAGVLRRLLEADPERPLADVPALDAGQERELLAWSAGERAAAPAASIGELFAARAAARPGAPALT